MENKKYVIGADIGGTTVKLGLFEEDGTLLEKWEIPTVIEGDGTAVLHDIAAEIQKCREKHNIPADGILGVGAGIPGPVTADGVVHRCVNLGWGVFDVRTALEETVGLPVVVVNDANAAAMGEAWKGGGRGSENVVFITLGTGVGGAVISDGRMVAGASTPRRRRRARAAAAAACSSMFRPRALRDWHENTLPNTREKALCGVSRSSQRKTCSMPLKTETARQTQS